MSKNIRFANKTSTSQADDILEMILPTFVLCLRDFTLDLQKDGKEITADEYLEDSLELKSGKGEDLERFNRLRASIKTYFPVRKCFTFDMPGNRKIIKQLETLDLDDLSEKFAEETRAFLRYVYQQKPKVLLHSKPVTGIMFGTLVKTYVDAIKNGAVPDVDEAISVVAKIENERMAKVAVAEFRKLIEKVQLPILQREIFENLCESLKNKALAQFRSEAVFNSEKFEVKAISQHVLNAFLEDESEKETEIMIADQNLTEEDRKKEADRMHQEHIKAREQQQKLFEEIMREEQERADQHAKMMENETEEKRRIETEKLSLLTEQFKQQRKITVKQLQTMIEENNKIREENQKIIANMMEAFAKKEREKEEAFEVKERLMTEMAEKRDREFQEMMLRTNAQLADERSRTAAAEARRDRENAEIRERLEKSLKDERDRSNKLHKREKKDLPETSQAELPQAEMDKCVVPNVNVFNRVNTKERYSDSFIIKCQSVCHYLLRSSKNITTVWPAYQYSKDNSNDEYKNIIFVVISKSGDENLTAFNYNIYQRADKKCSSTESQVLNKKESELETLDQDIEQIEDCIAKHSDEILKMHRKITMIAPSYLKSKQFGTQNEQIDTKACIVMYTQIKGLIPLTEEPFPEEIDGFPVDVREATFTLAHNGPSDYHKSVKMGCEIGGDKLNSEGKPLRGTLGGFVDHSIHGPCFFTCAHVLIPDLTTMARVGPERLIWNEDDDQISVFQPSLVTDRFGVAFGRVVKAVFDGAVGVDAALIKIIKREPVAGDFPSSCSDGLFSDERPMIYNTGQILESSNLQRNNVVYKFGASTNITRGVLQVKRGIVCSENRDQDVDGMMFSLKNQLFIYGAGGIEFSAKGDSGALVFIENQNHQLIAIGMVEGNTDDNRSVVTPIHNVIQELELHKVQMKRF